MSTTSGSAEAASKNEYVLPKVWKQEGANGGKWSGINRPTAGARHEQELPRGKHPLQLYSMGTPNGVKVTILLEELLEAGVKEAEYDAFYINIGEGEQFGSGFVTLNPNSKIPALLDTTTNTRMFESGSILLQLSEKFNNTFCPPELRSEVLNWLFWQMGAAPYLGGGFGHFYHYAPYKMKYPIDRFTMEIKRQLDVLERQLAENNKTYLLGDDYTLADIAIYPWYGTLVLGKGYPDADVFLNAKEEYPNVVRWAQHVAGRPAVIRGSMVNKRWGEEHEQLEERHDAADFDENLSKL
ncbi:GST-like protein SMU_1296 [Seminavis robusta]|uniref:GST-like protein SMU_1296 n=1 Tax=Seminavis robusta TaxID=568900 RepID=A0A9N8EET6_9STRA|nr:GST-like protein SMU_1296 [Seminavis robusta]|eukprot:Sro896_g217310.1 GST-like protein SMU_1296 (297) ;mRNA; f:12432-13418